MSTAPTEIIVYEPRVIQVPKCVHKAMYGITRLESGWQVTLGDPLHNFYYSNHFADSAHQSKSKALIAAKLDRNARINDQKFLRWACGRTMGPLNTTGADGVSCSVKYGAHFIVGDPRPVSEGRQIIRFFDRGAWYGYQIALNMRAQFVGGTVEPARIAQLYDEVFLPNWIDRLKRHGVEWRRDL